MAEEVVVAGGGFGGLSSAMALGRKGYDVRLIVRDGHLTYTPGLIDLIRGRVDEQNLRLELQEFLEGLPVEFCEEEILGFRPEEGMVETDAGSYSYGKLVLALGGDVMDFGMDISGVEKCYTFSQARSLKEKADESGEAVVVGAGYTGVEIAGELSEKGLDVTVVDKITRPMPNSSRKTSEIVLDYMNEKDISFKGDRKVVEVEEDGIGFADGTGMDTEMVVWSTGITSSEAICESFGCGREGVKVNSGLSCEGFSDVYAVGDCADHGFEKTAHNAMRMGKLVAENIDRAEGQPLKDYSPGFDPLIVSLGKTGVFTWNGRAYRNSSFRYMKDLVRKGYWTLLRKQKLLMKLSL